MPTVLDTLRKGTEYLKKHGVEEARLNMEHLVAHVLKADRMQVYLEFDRPLDGRPLETLRDLLRRRGRGEPLQHLLGAVEFCGLEFKVDSRALIPRPETEELVSLLLPGPWPASPAILDMGCGAGAIGLTLASRLAAACPRVVLADISGEAIELARENAAALGLPEDGLSFVCSDLFAGVEGSFDLAAANLPYIPAGESTLLSREVRRDPPAALYGGELGTEIMVRFLEEARTRLNPGGRVALEFGAGQAPPLREAAADLGYDPVETRRDLSGTDRFLFAGNPG